MFSWKRILKFLICAMAASFASCMSYGPNEEEDFGAEGSGVFIVHEGNFMYGNASLSYYDPAQEAIENGVFYRANGERLGDVAQSMTIHNGWGYIVVNNWNTVFAIDKETFKIVGEIRGLTSPRYIHFLSNDKAYITDLYEPRITIVNPQTFEVTGKIPIGEHTSTEQMVQYGQYIFINCWSYDNTILVIDSETDEVCDSITLGIQPSSMIIDKYDKIWVLTDGGYEGSPYGWTTPSLYRIDAATREVEKEFSFKLEDWPMELQLNGAGDALYFINGGVWRHDVTEERLPLRPFIEDNNTRYYGLGVDPLTGEVYLADAIDFMQPGIVYRYSAEGELLGSFRTGITPGAFCFKSQP